MSGTPDPGACPFEVTRPLMLQRWETLTFLHWPMPPGSVQRLLPRGLEVETTGGSAWVGLVPFFMRVGVAGVESVPWLSRFCETNVRTYVRDASTGRSGIWFFSLDAARLAAVLVARATFRLPYLWSQMSLERSGDVVRYRCRRRWPGPRGARSDVTVEVGAPLRPDELTPFEHFLTARWILFSMTPRRRSFGRAWHAPWPLHRARVRHLHDELVAAAGLPAPQSEPLAHYSPGVDVRIGALEAVTPRR